ncbi:TPA: hypothetical protein N0F65_012246 [Lagenidium giganteum]|uniref:Uncharacterized protein n=1 Tax=Lagenidium giganteum TaxID=4803 RepID=A0AAV2ZB61_9STRA|nr:TPA: hypothetical protein N0F65_012246 [Lagenidium giganteum]
MAPAHMDVLMPTPEARRQRSQLPLFPDRSVDAATRQFVCNVSRDDMVERDVDLEIEARLRTTHLSDGGSTATTSRSSAESSCSTLQPESHGIGIAAAGTRTSQRILRQISKRTASQRAQRSQSVESSSSSESNYSAIGKAASNDANCSGIRLTWHLRTDHLIGTDARMDRLRGTNLSTTDSRPSNATHRSSTHRSSSCTERLEARLSNKKLVSINALSKGDRSAVYAERQTYPTDTVKKVADTRLSEGISMRFEGASHTMTVVSKPRPSQTQPTRHTRVEKVRQENKKDQGVSFHFFGGTQCVPPNRKTLTLTFGPNSAPPAAPSRATHPMGTGYSAPAAPYSAPVNHATTLQSKYETLAAQLSDIEMLVDGIEACMSAASFSTLAKAVIRELELLKGTTKKIRTNGASLILGEVGQPSAETVSALRRLVAKAAALQKRIEMLLVAVKKVGV